MRKLGIDYGDSRVGIAITDPLCITAQGLETIHHKGNDKIVLKRLEEIMQDYEIDKIKSSFDNVYSIYVVNQFGSSKLTIEQQSHITENALENYTDFDYIIANDELDKLKEKVFAILDKEK